MRRSDAAPTMLSFLFWLPTWPTRDQCLNRAAEVRAYLSLVLSCRSWRVPGSSSSVDCDCGLVLQKKSVLVAVSVTVAVNKPPLLQKD